MKHLIKVAVVGALLLPACGGDDDGATSGSAATTASAQVTTSANDATTATEPSTAESSAPTGSAAGEPVSGGALTYASRTEATGLDPIDFTWDSMTGDGVRGMAIYDSIVYQTPDTQELVYRIGESLTSDDGITWTLKLRDGVKFSDGTPYDAEAVKLNWERLATTPGSKTQAVASAISAMTVVDPLTLEIVLKSPNGQFPRTVARFPLNWVGSPTAIQADPDGFRTKPVGAGPFLVDEWVRDDHLSLVRNPDYWNSPRPYLDKFTLRIILDRDQSYETFASGDVDMLFDPPAVKAAEADQDGYEAQWYRPSGGVGLQVNMATAPFDDVRVRQALQLAIDRELYNEVVNQGASRVPDAIMSPDSPFADPAGQLPATDHDEAQELFSEYAKETGKPVTFTLDWPDTLPAEGNAILTQLQGFDDVQVDLKMTAAPTWLENRGTGNFQVLPVYATFADPDPTMYDVFHTDGVKNYGKYSNPEVDAALEAGRTSTDEQERFDAYVKVQELIIADAPFIFYGTVDLANLYTEKVQDFAASGENTPLTDQLWIKP